jgi:hypothetical protein
MMSRKDYREFAEIISAEISVRRDTPAAVEAVKSIAYSMADVFKRDNSRFDRERFYTACGIERANAN